MFRQWLARTFFILMALLTAFAALLYSALAVLDQHGGAGDLIGPAYAILDGPVALVFWVITAEMIFLAIKTAHPQPPAASNQPLVHGQPENEGYRR